MGGMGGGGGMFAVPDEPNKPQAKSAPPATKLAVPIKPQTLAKPAGAAAPAAKDIQVIKDTKAATQSLPLSTTSSVPSSSVAARGENWNDLVRQYEKADDKAKSSLDAEVREIVTSLVASAQKAVESGDEKVALGHFESVIGLINQMLRAGHPQPWMYQALSLSMKACKYPSEDIERVMLSSLDFNSDTAAAIDIAEYFAQNQMKREALSLLRDAAVIDPYSYELFALALPLARELNDLNALRWTCAGVLSKAWPAKYDRLVEDARLAARATSLRLKQEQRVTEATAFENEIKEAMRRDIVVRVSWTGDAEIALRVKEPVGTICSYSNPQTLSGGVLFDSASTRNAKNSMDGTSEYYVCPQGYAGEYDILLRRIYGKVAGGKATVEVLTDYGTPDQRSVVQQVAINEKDALIQVAVKNGHRKEPMAAADLASVRQRQVAAGRSVLAQVAGSSGSTSTSGSVPGAYNPYAAMQALLAAGAANNGFPFRGAVGYRPVIQTIPEGASLFTTGVVSADRRYVRIAPTPTFSQIGEVFTFNFVDGTTGGGAGTTGGAGGQAGGGGGFGGGGGGGVF